MLEQQGDFNDISTKLRAKLEERVNSFGRYVRYKFNLARPNPDPSHYNGAVVYPSQYNLHPVQWKITDNEEDRQGKQKLKSIGVIEKVERDDRGNIQYRYTGLRITSEEKGIKLFDMEKQEDVDMVASLELHPKNGNGLFTNKEMIPVFSRIDEGKVAIDERAERTARKKAMDAAELMSDAEIREFADAMATEEWNSTQDMIFLRNKVEKLSETTPVLFNDLISSEKFKTRAIIKKAIDSRILEYNPSEGSISWLSTKQQIIALGINGTEKTDIERFADWFIEAGNKADVVLKKLKSLVEKPSTVDA